MSLSDSLPWAIAAGRNAGEAERVTRIANKWIDYAHQLEKQVEFYRREAGSGWAAFRALRDVSGVSPKEDPEMYTKYQKIKDMYYKETLKDLDQDAPKT